MAPALVTTISIRTGARGGAWRAHVAAFNKRSIAPLPQAGVRLLSGRTDQSDCSPLHANTTVRVPVCVAGSSRLKWQVDRYARHATRFAKALTRACVFSNPTGDGMSKDMGGAIPSAALRVNQRPMVSETPDEYVFSPDAGRLRLTTHTWRAGEKWWAGDFVDYRGIVSILRQSDLLRLDTVAGNRCHVRTYRSYYGDRTVAQLCRRFLTDLFGTPCPTPPASIASGDAEA